MKKDKLLNYIYKNWKNCFSIIFILVLVLIGGAFAASNSPEDEKRVSAHPTNPITLNPGDNSEFDLPTDGIELKEDQLINDNNFADYVQNDGFLLNPTKINVKGFSTVQPTQSILFSERTAGGNILAAGRVNYWQTGVANEHGLTTTYLFLLDPNNRLIDSKLVEGTSINHNRPTDPSVVDGTEASSLTRLSNGSFNMLARSELFNITLDQNETRIQNVVGNSLSFANGSAPNQMRDYNSVEVGLDNKVYYSGHWYENRGENDEEYLRNGRAVGILNSNGVEERRVRLRYNPGSSHFTNPWYMRLHRISGMNRSPNGGSIIGLMTYTNEDSIFYSKIVVWNSNGQMVREHRPEGMSNTIKTLDKISTTSERYFLVKNDTSSEVIRYSASTGNFMRVATFPEGTDFEIIAASSNTYNSIGYLSTVNGIFSPFHNSLSPESTFVANFNSDFEINSIVGMETGLERDLNITSATFLDNSRYFFSANFSELNVEDIPQETFVDSIIATLGSEPNWTRKTEGAGTGAVSHAQHDVFGVLESRRDYKPAIYAEEDITFNIDVATLDEASAVNTNYNWTVRDNWLITGSREGSISDSASIKVYDVYDTELSLNPQPNSWHYGRLNRNPLNINQGINWEALGLDEDDPGPQLLTYFVTDSQNQASVKSRWINKITDQTVTDDEERYALEAQNFHIPLTGIDGAIPTATAFKELAKTKAWSLTQHGENDGEHGNGIDETGIDSSKLSDKVTINDQQLQALRSAEVAKPYPVDVTYKPTNGIEIISRVWVFVTTSNTVPNTEVNPEVTPQDTNGVVYYADDYSIPYYTRNTHELEDILANGNIRAYDYYSKDRSSEQLTPLPNTTNNQSNWRIHDLDVIHDPFQGGVVNLPVTVQPILSYTWRDASDNHHTQNRETDGSLSVTLTGDIRLHVRQVVLNGSDKLVVPTKGYLNLKTLGFNTENGTHVEEPSQLIQTSMLSQATEDVPDFETFLFNSEHMDDIGDHLKFTITMPEFYEYVGNFVTVRHFDDPDDPLGSDHQNRTEDDLSPSELELPRMFLDMDGEYYITLYIRPTTAGQAPQPYSWDYKKNDLGVIQPDTP